MIIVVYLKKIHILCSHVKKHLRLVFDLILLEMLTFPTGLGQGEVLADEGLFSFSSGSSTEDIRMFFADNSLRLCTGLEGAKYTFKYQNSAFAVKFTRLNENPLQPVKGLHSRCKSVFSTRNHFRP